MKHATKHPDYDSATSCQTVKENNKHYIDPAESLCPKRASKLNVSGRAAAQRERMEVEEVTQSLQKDVYNTRDEVMSYSATGEPTFTVKPAWMKFK